MKCGRLCIVGLVSAALAIGALWITNRAVTPVEATMADVQAQAKDGGYGLLTTEQVAALYKKNPQELLLVDSRQEWEFRAGHIKKAINFPMEPTWWSRWRKQSDMTKVLGPDKDRLLVFY